MNRQRPSHPPLRGDPPPLTGTRSVQSPPHAPPGVARVRGLRSVLLACQGGTWWVLGRADCVRCSYIALCFLPFKAVCSCALRPILATVATHPTTTIVQGCTRCQPLAPCHAGAAVIPRGHNAACAECDRARLPGDDRQRRLLCGSATHAAEAPARVGDCALARSRCTGMQVAVLSGCMCLWRHVGGCPLALASRCASWGALMQ